MRLELTPSERERFEAKIYRIPGGCWIWIGTTLRGYGTLAVGSRADGSRRTLRAHRVAWTLYRGPIPDGLWVLHHCPGGDWPACVNPDHLWLGTDLDNAIDKAKKGRGRKGKLPFGVRRNRRTTRLRAQVSIGGTTRYLGMFPTIKEAHEAAVAAVGRRLDPNPHACRPAAGKEN